MIDLPNIITHTAFAKSEGTLYLDVDGSTTVDIGRQSRLNGFITQYQRLVLLSLLGEKLYNYLIDNQNEPVYITLRDGEMVTLEDGTKEQWRGLVNMLPGFVYFYFSQKKQSEDTPDGMMKSDNENSIRSISGLNDKIITNWDLSQYQFREAIGYIQYKNSQVHDYYPYFTPNFCEYSKEITHVI